MSGQNIGSIMKGLSVEECQQRCTEEPTCKSIEYGVPHGGNGTVYKQGDCQLNSASDPKECDGYNNNLDLYIRVDCDGEYFHFYNSFI